MVALLLGTLAASTLLFSKLAEDVAAGEPIVSLDRTVALGLHTHSTDPATGLMSAVTQLGGTQALLTVTLAAVLALMAKRRLAHAALMAAALIGGQALNWALKASFERPRPSFSEPLATAAGYSFPSGHAMVSLTVYGALAFVVATSIKSRRARTAILASALTLILTIGFSRIYLGVHYVSDVLAAYAAGAAWLSVCALTAVSVERRDSNPRPPA